ncbi:MAG: HD domain-containing protein [Fibrobacterales bacterium]
MVRYPIEDLIDGLVLAEPILDKNRKLLVAENTCLNAKLIGLLKERGYSSILIHVEGTDTVVPNETLGTDLKYEVSSIIDEVTKGVGQRIESAQQQKSSILEVLKSEKHNITKMIQDKKTFEMVDKILDSLISEPVTSIVISKLQSFEDTFFEHVLRVVVTSLALGIKFGFNKLELTDLGKGALAYDIGMLAVPETIRRKQGELTEEEFTVLKQHTLYGHMMLSEIPNFSAMSTIIALSHHEHQDGTGYPRGLKGTNKTPIKQNEGQGCIHRYADIVRAADLYDMYTFGRPHYSLPLNPQLVVKKLVTEAGKTVNASVLKMLLSIVSIYPVGAKVKIIQSPIAGLDGYYGVVARVNEKNIMAPSLIMLEDKEKQTIKPIVVDMSKYKGFQIELLT